MLANSGVYGELARNSFNPAGHPLCLYGDPAYPLRVRFQAPFRNVVRTQQMQDFYSSMSAVRSSIKWLFGDIINDFKFLDIKKNLKIGLSSEHSCMETPHPCFSVSILQIFMTISLKLSVSNTMCQWGILFNDILWNKPCTNNFLADSHTIPSEIASSTSTSSLNVNTWYVILHSFSFWERKWGEKYMYPGCFKASINIC